MTKKKLRQDSSLVQFRERLQQAAIAGEIAVRDTRVALTRRRKYFQLFAHAAWLHFQSKRLARGLAARPRYTEDELAFIQKHGFPPDLPFSSSLQAASDKLCPQNPGP